MIKKIFIFFIEIYQKTISPDHSILGELLFPFGLCRYQISCSQYFKMKLQQESFLKALYLGLRRLLSCNPFSKELNE